MTADVKSATSSIGLFLAHAVALETEAAERYEDLADSMDAHNNVEVAALFRQMAVYARKHRDEVVVIAKPFEPLPPVAPWEFAWGSATESPEAAAFEDTHYLMTAHHALKTALGCEIQANRYYAGVAAAARDRRIATLAQEFADEEAEHVELVRQWLKRYPAPPEGWDEDPDPPNVSD